jgi:shikimate kinase
MLKNGDLMDRIKDENIVLIGFMGCGKTSVGKRLASRLHYSFTDTDQMIEKKAGCSINQIFETKGEAFFREMETDLLEEMQATIRRTVIATGGGLPVKKPNRELLKNIGQVMYLKVTKETIIKRLSGDTTRPKLKGNDIATKVEMLLTEREPIYEETADYVIECDNKSFYEIIETIIDALQKGGRE